MGTCLRPSEDATSLRCIRVITSAFGVVLDGRCATAAAFPLSLSHSCGTLLLASHRTTVKKRGAHTRKAARGHEFLRILSCLSLSLCVCIALRVCVCVCLWGAPLDWPLFLSLPASPTPVSRAPTDVRVRNTVVPLRIRDRLLQCRHDTTLRLPAFSLSCAGLFL